MKPKEKMCAAIISPSKTIFKYEFKKIHLTYLYGFLLFCLPTQPFIYDFLNKETQHSFEDILSVYFNSATVEALVVLVLSLNVLPHKIFMVMTATAGLVGSFFVVCGKIGDDLQLKIAAGFFGVLLATFQAYETSIYINADIKDYKNLTTLVKFFPLLGKMVSSIIGYILISQEVVSTKNLYYINFSSLTLALLVSFFLPSHREEMDAEKQQHKHVPFVSAFFPNKFVAKYFLWSSLTMCGFYQLTFNIQNLWHQMHKQQSQESLNGLGMTLAFFFSALLVMASRFINFDWKLKGDLILSCTSMVQAVTVISISQTQVFWLDINLYLVFLMSHNFFMTLVAVEIAKNLQGKCFPIFSLINFLGLFLCQCIFYLVKLWGFELSTQILLCGFYNLLITVIFIVIGLIYWFSKSTF